MPDYFYHTYPHLGIAVPNNTPFSPLIKNIAGTGEDKGKIKARFNQGYIFDYQTRDGKEKTIAKIKVESMDQDFDVKDGAKFFLRITTPSDDAQVSTASFERKELNEKGDLDENFHYSAKHLDDDEEIYNEGVGQFLVPVCKIGKDGVLEDLYLRDNVHWQKTNYANIKKEDPADEKLDEAYGILRNWGDGNKFNNSPNVEFKRVRTRTLDAYQDEPELVIKIEKKGNNLLFKNQFPPVPKDTISILQRNAEEGADADWEWCSTESPKKEYILVGGHSGGEKRAIWFEIPPDGGILRGLPRKGEESGEIHVFPYPEISASDDGEPYILAFNGDLYWKKECCDTDF